MDVTSCERLTLASGFTPDTELEHLRRYRFASAFVKGLDVVDVACGSGYGSRILADAGARSVRGFDLEPEAAVYATEHYSAPNLVFKAGNAESLVEVADQSADLVVSFETIEHLHHVEKYLDEIHRILRPGGQFIVSTPDRRLASTMYPIRGRPNNPYHVQEFTEREFRWILAERFRIEDFGGQNFISSVLTFWPLQVSLKAIGYALRRLGGAEWVRRTYHLGSGFDILPSKNFAGHVARFWVARCRKTGTPHDR